MAAATRKGTTPLHKVTSGSKDGYTFAIQGCTSAASGSRVVSYQIVATPEVPGTTGIKAFCTDGDGTITIWMSLAIT